MAPNTILLNVIARNEKEYPLASEDNPITPGMLCEINADGKVIPHDEAAGVVAPFIVATEMPIRSGSGIDDDYNETGEAVSVHYAQSGDRLYMMLEAGANVAYNAQLESSGNGHLQAGTTNPIARAIEAVNNSAGYDGARIRVEVL